MAHSSGESGFTLLELMISLTIGGILLAMAIPGFRDFTASTRLTTQANDIVGAITLARSEAIKRNATVAFCRVTSATDTACATNAASWTNWVVATTGGSVIRRGSVDAHNGAIVVKSTLDSDELLFTSDGLAQAGGAPSTGKEIDICATNIDKNNKRQVELGAGSRISTITNSGGC